MRYTFLKSKKADGNAYLILFIASILVAGVAASVLYITSIDLQNKAITTGQKTQDEVGTVLDIIEVTGEDGLNPQGTVRDFKVRFKLMPGSEPVKLAYIALDTVFEGGNAQVTVVDKPHEEQNCTRTGSVADSGYWTDPTTESGNFSYRYLKKAINWHDGYIQSGDVVEVCFMAPYEIPEESGFSMGMTIYGAVTRIIQGMTPDAIITQSVRLYPNG